MRYSGGAGIKSVNNKLRNILGEPDVGVDMSVNESYVVTDPEEVKAEESCKNVQYDHIYTYDEALDLAGHGTYSRSLLAILSVAILSMAMDIFGFSVVVSGASCEFNLGIRETGILLTVTFIGPIVMAYPWGYISDTLGRRRSLIISLWTSYIISSASAFAPNWVTLAAMKLVSTSFSSCAQAAVYTLLGESCTQRYRDAYILIMTSVLDFSLAIYVVLAYLILNADFSYDMGFLSFAPWRALSLALSFITGLGAVGVLFFYESPKFLLNIGRHDEAVQALAGIWTRNGGKGVYPVSRVIMDEVGNDRVAGSSIWRSLWDQLVPIFKPPLLWRTLQLYFITAVTFSTNNSYYIWLPYLGEQFVKNIDSNETKQGYDICTLISSAEETAIDEACTTRVDISLVWFSVAQGVSFVLLILLVSRIAYMKRFLTLVIFAVSAASAIGAVLVQNVTVGFLMLMGVMLNELMIGVIYSYFVDLYPTSYRGMASCLATVVARGGALAGVGVLGAMLESHCAHSFYICSALLFSGFIVALFLPKDKPRKQIEDEIKYQETECR